MTAFFKAIFRYINIALKKAKLNLKKHEIFLGLFCVLGTSFSSRGHTHIPFSIVLNGSMLEKGKLKLTAQQYRRAKYILKPQSFICLMPESIHLYNFRLQTRNQVQGE